AGLVLANQDTDSLENGPNHDAAKVLAFLKRWAADPNDAERVLETALSKAETGHKMVFLRVGAPGSDDSRKLDDFLARPDISAILATEFVDLKIDEERMANGRALVARFRGESTSRSHPWIAFLDSKGKVLVTSDLQTGRPET